MFVNSLATQTHFRRSGELGYRYKNCHSKKIMHECWMPNEHAGIGITVRTDICVAFSKTGWLVEAIALLIQPYSPACRQGLVGVALI